MCLSNPFRKWYKVFSLGYTSLESISFSNQKGIIQKLNFIPGNLISKFDTLVKGKTRCSGISDFGKLFKQNESTSTNSFNLLAIHGMKKLQRTEKCTFYSWISNKKRVSELFNYQISLMLNINKVNVDLIHIFSSPILFHKSSNHIVPVLSITSNNIYKYPGNQAQFKFPEKSFFVIIEFAWCVWYQAVGIF